MAAWDSKKMTLKLLVDSGNNKVLFAEAGKDFVDIMFSLLLLPLGSVIKLITPRITLGSIGKLCRSVEKISETYLVANRDKSTLLQPSVSALAGACPFLRTWTFTPDHKKTYCCIYCRSQVIVSNGNTCTKCYQSIDLSRFNDVKAGVGIGGESVEGIAKGIYMITDDLEVTPMSTMSSITLINRFSMKKDVRLVEKAVVVGMDEGLALLEASLKSATALTDVFLNSSTKKASSSV